MDWRKEQLLVGAHDLSINETPFNITCKKQTVMMHEAHEHWRGFMGGGPLITL